MPQYVAGNPDDSAADVRAQGAWANGRWTLEFERRLDTRNPDDTAFNTRRVYMMALAAFDRTGEMDKASDLVELNFAQARGGKKAK